MSPAQPQCVVRVLDSLNEMTQSGCRPRIFCLSSFLPFFLPGLHGRNIPPDIVPPLKVSILIKDRDLIFHLLNTRF